MNVNGYEICPGADLCGADLCGADLHGADLRGADLSEANLRGAILSGADLREAILREADLREAILREADLREADLREAILRGANLRGANLREADLREADLCGANLRGANLREAILREADLREADLCGANLRGALGVSPLIAANMSILPEGDVVGYKKTRDGVVKLLIPRDAKRSNATSRKCRAEFAIVLELPPGVEVARSLHDRNFTYRADCIVRATEPFDEDRWAECASGIHFFLTREEAEDY